MNGPYRLSEFDPVAISLGPVDIRWYALAYIAGLLLGWTLMRRLARSSKGPITDEMIDDFLVWATFGVVIGGRLGYVLFYQPAFYLSNPIEILKVWQGGMAFHGGLIGVIAATFLFARKRGIPVLQLGDMVTMAAPIGLFFGRIANFVNGELFGRPTDVPWAMIFPTGGPEGRHPSQLYEAALEGLVLFLVMLALSRVPAVRDRHGSLAGVFLAGYGIARFIAEFFRQPDPFLGFLWAGATMGQMLSLPMVVIGFALLAWAQKRPAAA